MSIWTIIRESAKFITPKPVWGKLRTWRHARISERTIRRAARDFYNMYYKSEVDRIFPSLLKSKEGNNFIYDLNGHNIEYLAATVGCVTGIGFETAYGYISEACSDSELREAAEMPEDIYCGFARRLGWYAIARAMKPKIIVETGVERGHGSLILCAALLRNSEEGFSGRYFGLDLDLDAGRLFKGRYTSAGTIIYGDSITSLSTIDEKIDLFINDSDHSASYEYSEYVAIKDKLSERAIILGDNAHATNELAKFSRENGRNFLFFKEQPKLHWYPGAGIGISFVQ